MGGRWAPGVGPTLRTPKPLAMLPRWPDRAAGGGRKLRGRGRGQGRRGTQADVWTPLAPVLPHVAASASGTAPF